MLLLYVVLPRIGVVWRNIDAVAYSPDTFFKVHYAYILVIDKNKDPARYKFYLLTPILKLRPVEITLVWDIEGDLLKIGHIAAKLAHAMSKLKYAQLVLLDKEMRRRDSPAIAS